MTCGITTTRPSRSTSVPCGSRCVTTTPSRRSGVRGTDSTGSASKTMVDDATKRFDLDTLYIAYQEDRRFEVLRAQGRFVPGEGALTTPLLLVGEAPGAEE